MTPTLRDGDRLLVRAVVGRPGGSQRSSGTSAAQGQDDPRVASLFGRVAVVRLPGGRPLAVKRLTGHGPDGWWVERDNPAEGVDSWLVGAVPDDDLLGLVVLRVWPRPGRVR